MQVFQSNPNEITWIDQRILVKLCLRFICRRVSDSSTIVRLESFEIVLLNGSQRGKAFQCKSLNMLKMVKNEGVLVLSLTVPSHSPDEKSVKQIKNETTH